MSHNVSQLKESVNQENFEQMLTAAEVCRALNISRPTFCRYVREGRLPAVKIGGRWKMQRALLREIQLKGDGEITGE